MDSNKPSAFDDDDDDVICLSPDEANDVIKDDNDNDDDDEVFKRPNEAAPATAATQPQTHQLCTATFKDKTIENLMKKSTSTGAGSKINESAVKVTGELLRIYSMELLTRAAEQAMKEDGGGEGASAAAAVVTTDHLEKILAQFLLDFN